jgi:long-chain fatty acid transport protein
MTRRRSSFKLLALILTLGVAALPAPVFASGFQLVEQNASGLGNAFAGQAAGVKNASAIYFNPAALTRVKGWNFVASVEPIGVGATFSNSGSTVPSASGIPFPVPLGNEGGDAGKWIPVPNGYLSGQVTERIWLGVGVNVPFGLETNWDPAWIGRFHATRSKVEAYNVNPTIALQLSDVLSIGGGASWQHLKADLGSTVAYGGVAYYGSLQALVAQGLPPAVAMATLNAVLVPQLGPSGVATETPALISGDSNAWGWNAGALLKLGAQAHVGVSYRSKVKHDVTGTVTFTGVPTITLPGGLAPIGTTLNTRFADGPVTTTIELPDTFSVAAAWENDKVEVLADYTSTGWDSIQSLDIKREGASENFSSVPLNFQSTWRAGLGVNVKLNDKATLRLGTAYDKAPVRDEFRTPRLPDDNRVWASGGFEWKVSQKATIDVGYTHIFVRKDSTSDLPNQETPTSTPVGNLVGTYSNTVDVLGVQLSLHFSAPAAGSGGARPRPGGARRFASSTAARSPARRRLSLSGARGRRPRPPARGGWPRAPAAPERRGSRPRPGGRRSAPGPPARGRGPSPVPPRARGRPSRNAARGSTTSRPRPRAA